MYVCTSVCVWHIKSDFVIQLCIFICALRSIDQYVFVCAHPVLNISPTEICVDCGVEGKLFARQLRLIEFLMLNMLVLCCSREINRLQNFWKSPHIRKSRVKNIRPEIFVFIYMVRRIGQGSFFVRLTDKYQHKHVQCIIKQNNVISIRFGCIYSSQFFLFMERIYSQSKFAYSRESVVKIYIQEVYNVYEHWQGTGKTIFMFLYIFCSRMKALNLCRPVDPNKNTLCRYL